MKMRLEALVSLAVLGSWLAACGSADDGDPVAETAAGMAMMDTVDLGGSGEEGAEPTCTIDLTTCTRRIGVTYDKFGQVTCYTESELTADDGIKVEITTHEVTCRDEMGREAGSVSVTQTVCPSQESKLSGCTAVLQPKFDQIQP